MPQWMAAWRWFIQPRAFIPCTTRDTFILPFISLSYPRGGWLGSLPALWRIRHAAHATSELAMFLDSRR